MGAPLTAQSLVTKIQRRINDLGGAFRTPTEILDEADTMVDSVWIETMIANQLFNLDFVTFAVTAFTNIELHWNEIALPENVGAIEKVEGVFSGTGTPPLPFDEAKMWNKDLSRGRFVDTGPRWMRTSTGRPGKISVFGEINSLVSVRIWFSRTYPPMHYGTAGGGSADTIIFGATPDGRVMERDGVYEQVDIEITNDTPAGIRDDLRRITSYDGSTQTATVDANWSGTPTTGTEYSLILPIERVHTLYFVELAVHHTLLGLGNPEMIAAQAPMLNYARQQFENHAMMRDAAVPRTVYNSRS